MDSEASSSIQISSIVPCLFPSLGPALLISVGYIDIGKWVVAVDGGARFGFDLMLLVFAFNCTAILCQYLAARVGVVTGQNLAQICRKEYSRLTCISLGVQAELSAIVFELNMIVGIAHVLNHLSGLDLLTCVFLTAIDAILFPLFTKLLDKCKTDMLCVCIAGFALLFYVLGVLISQPEIPLVMNGIFPKLSGESVYSIMSLLGASVMPHNFYLHSSIVQLQQQRQPNVSTGTLCHDHFFAILFIFSCIFLVNYVVMLSAATIFHSAGFVVLTLQDALDQIFRSPLAPFVVFLVLFFSSQVMALTWNIGGRVVLHNLVGVNPPVWAHRLTVKSIAIMPVLYCAWNFGAEGIYQLLIFSQVILALLLPASVIPLFRVASSRSIMGVFEISRFLKMLASSAFFVMVLLNIIFLVEIFFGDTDLMRSLRWDIWSGVTFSYVLVLTACASLALMIWLAATPLKSARNRSDGYVWDQGLQKAVINSVGDGEEKELDMIRNNGDDGPMAEELVKPTICHSDKSVVEFDFDQPKNIIDSNNKPEQSADRDHCSIVSSSLRSHIEGSTAGLKLVPIAPVDEVPSSRLLKPHIEGSTAAVKLAPTALVDGVPLSGLLDESVLQRNESKDDPVGSTAGGMRDAEGAVKNDDVQGTVKDDDEADVWEPEEPSAGLMESDSTLTSEGPGSFRSVSGKNDDVGSGSGSLSRLSGLGRAARRQLAAVLDEFWGQLFDYHGQLTQDAKAKGMDVVLGFELKSISSLKADATGMGYARDYYSDAGRGSAVTTASRDYDSLRQQRMASSLESSYRAQMGSSSWTSYLQPSDAYMQSSGSSLLETSERRYSSLRLPSYSEDRDHQPATVHGYQIASYLNKIAAEGSTSSLRIPWDPSTAKSMSAVPNHRDPLSYSLGQNGIGSLHPSNSPSPMVSTVSRLQAGNSYYDPSLVGVSGTDECSAYPKKYHSLPDISGLIVSTRRSSSDRNPRRNSPIGPVSSVGKTSYEQPLYSSPASSAKGVPFDEFSPSKNYSDPFSLPLISDLDTKSLWSRQPSEQLFGIVDRPRNVGHGEVLQENISCTHMESKILKPLRYCIIKLLNLEGADWLFQQNGGFDEELIDRVAAAERFRYESVAREWGLSNIGDSSYMSSECKFVMSPVDEEGLTKFLASSVPHCGENCIWHGALIFSFGVWCIHRVLVLCLMESRPELWGKYTYVLNRLQGILEPAFSKLRPSIAPCTCLQIPVTHVKRSGLLLPNGLQSTSGKLGRKQTTSASMLLDLIKDVEAAISCRKGRIGTAAGDVAFPKGKENLASVLKRYKRRLSSKALGTHESGPGLRKIPVPTSL